MKSKTIIAAFVLVVVIMFAYIGLGAYNKKPSAGHLGQDDVPIVSSETPVYDHDIVGTKWHWERTVTGEEGIVFPRVHDAFTITFTEDGGLNGSTDCNGFSTQYEKDGNNIKFDLFASTQMYCENSQEEIFKKSLAEVEEFSFDENGKLILSSGTSSIIFVDKDSLQNKNNWDLIKQAITDCNIQGAGQTHDRKVRVTLKNGDQLQAYSPKIDNIFDIVNDVKDKCGKVMLWTE